MNVKGGTQTWSNAAQTSALKGDGSITMSAQDVEKVLGDGENMGEVLNKIADPNWVDPVKTRRVGNNQLDKDAFLKLMLAQMKHQDPTNPMQSHEMAAQLAQFTSLEQLNNINTNLEGMKAAQQPQTNYQALNFIGKKVAGDSSKVVRMNGDKHHDFNFVLAGDVQEAVVSVKDAEGNVVRKLKMANLKKGENKISWNGLDEDGLPSRPGDYRFVIEAKSASGAKVHARSEFDGKITGLNFTPEGPVLLVGQQSVRMQDVKKIYEPTAEEVLMDRAPVVPLEAGPQGKLSPGNVPAASDDGPVNALNKNVAMSRGIMNQVAKETGKESDKNKNGNG